jgi:dihydrofolate reductase
MRVSTINSTAVLRCNTANSSLTIDGKFEIINELYEKEYFKLYIDGGRTVQDFLKEDLVDELRITTIPILLGGGFPLFGNLTKPLEFEHIQSKLFLNQIVQNHYKEKMKSQQITSCDHVIG